MYRFNIFAAIAFVMTLASTALAVDNAALIGKWQLVEIAMDKHGKPCPFVGKQLEFTTDGKMISPNMPVPFRYKVNPAKAEVGAAISKNPELKGMEIMLAATGNSKIDWTKARIVYGIHLKDNQFTMKVPGYTPARYMKQK